MGVSLSPPSAEVDDDFLTCMEDGHEDHDSLAILGRATLLMFIHYDQASSIKRDGKSHLLHPLPCSQDHWPAT